VFLPVTESARCNRFRSLFMGSYVTAVHLSIQRSNIFASHESVLSLSSTEGIFYLQCYRSETKLPFRPERDPMPMLFVLSNGRFFPGCEIHFCDGHPRLYEDQGFFIRTQAGYKSLIFQLRNCACFSVNLGTFRFSFSVIPIAKMERPSGAQDIWLTKRRYGFSIRSSPVASDRIVIRLFPGPRLPRVKGKSRYLPSGDHLKL